MNGKMDCTFLNCESLSINHNTSKCETLAVVTVSSYYIQEYRAAGASTFDKLIFVKSSLLPLCTRTSLGGSD